MTSIRGLGLADAGSGVPAPGAEAWPSARTPPRWGRFDPPTRALCLACGRALRDASARGTATGVTGLVRAGRDGCHAANRAYFADYVHGGRTLGRSSLFVHTLPTSPGAEAALLFNLCGPSFYLGFAQATLASLLDAAVDVLRAGGADHMLAVAADGARAAAFLLARPDAGALVAWPAWASLPLMPLPPDQAFSPVINPNEAAIPAALPRSLP